MAATTTKPRQPLYGRTASGYHRRAGLTKVSGPIQLRVLTPFSRVDARNRPAWDLYCRVGFEPFDQREVFLATWRPLLRARSWTR
jgi:hypothetical protein